MNGYTLAAVITVSVAAVLIASIWASTKTNRKDR